jgi:hypothetical protein
MQLPDHLIEPESEGLSRNREIEVPPEVFRSHKEIRYCRFEVHAAFLPLNPLGSAIISL